MTSLLSRNISRLLAGLLILIGLGSSTVSYSQTVITADTINSYEHVTGGAATGTDFVIVADTNWHNRFEPGDTVLLIQMKGILSNITETPSYGMPQDFIGSPGKYEFLIISSTNKLTKTISLRSYLINNYDVRGDVQLVKVPTYQSVVVNSNTYLTCQPWDSIKKTGGVLSIIVGKTLKLNKNIDVSGKGFLGGAVISGDGGCIAATTNYSYDFSATNYGLKGEGNCTYGDNYVPIFPNYSKGKGVNFFGGGGGPGQFSGGGGGGNYGAGGKGGSETCSSLFTGGLGGRGISGSIVEGKGTIFMGGGGGGSTRTTGTATAGGRGGGIIIILCNDLDGGGKAIMANGETPSGVANGNGGAGGGGAGGSIAIYLQKVTSNLTLSVNGGNGGESNNIASAFNAASEGGGGGGGLIWTNLSTIPGNVTTSILKGAKGVVPVGKTPSAANGADGTILYNFAPVLNGFLFNSIVSERTGNEIDSICSNNIPSKILGTSPAGGTTPYIVKWEVKNTSPDSSWRAVVDYTLLTAANRDYTFTVAQPDTFEIRRIINDSNATPLKDTSKKAIIVVQPQILRNNIKIISDIVSVTDTICFNGDPKLIDQSPLPDPDIFVPTTKNLFYTWQTRKAGSSLWSTAVGTAKSYDPPAGLQDTTYYRRTVASGMCTDSSGIVRVTVLPGITGNDISADQEICHGSTFADLAQKSGFTVAGGDNLYRYKWQYSATGANGTWSNATGTINLSGYNPAESLTDTEVNSYFRRMVYSGNHDVCKDSSASLHLTEWKKISNNSITSADQTICSGSVPALITGSSPLADGNHTYVIDWQQKHLAGTYATAAGTSDQLNYQPPALTDTTWYRRFVTSGVCKDSTNIVVVNVHKPLTNNKIWILPGLKDTTICAGQAVTLFNGSYPSGGTANIADTIFSWEVSSPLNNSFAAASGTITASKYNAGNLANAAVNNPLFYYYRRKFTSGMCSTFSDTIKVKVLSKISANTISADQAVCYNTVPLPFSGTVLTGGDVPTWLWKQSTDAGTTWNTAVNISNQQNYSAPALTVPTSYRRFIFSGLHNCCKDSSNIINVTINPLPVSTLSFRSDTVCEGAGRYIKLDITASSATPFKAVYKENNITTSSSTLSARKSFTGLTDSILVNPVNAASLPAMSKFVYTIDTLIDANGCKAVTRNGNSEIIVHKFPTIDAGSDKSVCGPKYRLLGITNFGTGSWTWPGTVPVAVPPTLANNDTVTVTLPGAPLSQTYRFYWNVINWQCSKKDSVNIRFDLPVSKAVAQNDTTITVFDGIFQLKSVTPVIGTGEWFAVEPGLETPVPNGEASNLKINPEFNDFKWLVVNGTCRDSDMVRITVFEVKPTNAFSPNGDGVNDVFEIRGLDVTTTEITITILNSAGTQVYYSTNKDGATYQPWNGENDKGVRVPDGTYYYVMTLKSLQNSKETPFSGYIVLKRDKR